MNNRNPRELPPVEVCFRFISNRFCGAILWYLMKHESMRYSELQRCLPYANSKVFASKLRKMEEDGIILRHSYGGTPPKVTYELTDLGKSLIPVVLCAHEWGLQYVRSLSREEAPYTEDARAIYDMEDP